MQIPARHRLVRSSAWFLPLAFSLAAMPALAAPPLPSPAVEEARGLFAEALADEDAARWSAALEKYRRVQAIRDTSPVRFRIALSTMKLGRITDARTLFLQTVDGTQVPSAEDANVGAASREAAAELATHLGYVRIDGPASRGNEKLVRIDGQGWSGAGMREVEPGAHVLLVEAADGSTREVPFSVREEETRTVRLFDGPVPPVAPAVSTPGTPGRVHEPLPRWPGFVGLGAGGALVVAGVVMLAVRESHVDAVTERCNGGVCETAARPFVEDQRGKAAALQVGGIAAVSVGAAGAAFGAVWLLVRRIKDTSAPRVGWSVFPDRGGAGATLSVAF